MSKATSLSEVVSAFALDVYRAPQRLPTTLLDTAAARVLDNIGCMYFGLRVPPAFKTVEMVVRMGQGQCPVIGFDRNTSPTAAALAHGILAQSFEMNDLGAYVHAGACVVPASMSALACVQTPVTGAQFSAAVALGYEVTVRLAEAIGPGAELDIGWHTPGFHGAVGASVATALLLGGDADMVAQTISIAADLAGGGLMVARLGSDTKRLHCGRGAETAMFAALLAREGLRCRLDALEHADWGYCRAMAGGKPAADLAALTDQLGAHWVGFDRTAVKYYCVGAEVLGAIDNLNVLKARDGFRISDIESITVGTPAFFVKAESHKYPGSPTEVHFNVEYAIAMALLHDIRPVYEEGGGLLSIWMSGYENPEVRQLSRKVRHVVDSELEERNPYSVDSKVTVRFKDGSAASSETAYVKKASSPGTMRFAPMGIDRIKAKFVSLTGHALSPESQNEFMDCVLSLPQAPSASVLLEKIC